MALTIEPAYGRQLVTATVTNCWILRLTGQTSVSDIFCNSLFMISLDKWIWTGRARAAECENQILQFCLCKKSLEHGACNTTGPQNKHTRCSSMFHPLVERWQLSL